MAIKIGVDYYPEQWDESLWERDVQMMSDAGVSIVRLAEFAWSRLEPKEGSFSFEWLDRIIELFADKGIDVVLGTPTCTPPLWLFEKYPETIKRDVYGNRVTIGIRGHRCTTSPVFREKAEKIISRMVGRYKDNKTVIAYQIDNELEANHCRCEYCEKGFREWMKKRYKTFDAVNSAYGNSVWSGEYSDFSQIKPPMGEHISWQNPSLTLDYNRYASDSTVEYLNWQRELISSIAPDAGVTTNTWFCENMPDFYKLFENMDFVSFDNYPTTSIPEDTESLYSHAFHLDLMRGIKNKNFWIMEQLSGAMGSWSNMSKNLYPGMLKGYALQAVAHGADAVVHFRWRTGCSGAEMYWHGIIDHNNAAGRRYAEFCDLCRTLSQYDDLPDSIVDNRVALLYGSDQEYAFKLQYQAEGLYYMEQLKSLHDAFTSIGLGVDIIAEDSDLSGYDIVLAPTLLVTKDAVRANLYAFAEKGGTVLLTNRSGVKDINNKCIMEELPTVYSRLTGVSINEYDVIGNERMPLRITDDELRISYQRLAEDIFGGCDNESLAVDETIGAKRSENPVCTQWCDLIKADGARVLMEYTGRYYDGTPAVTENVYGRGRAYYLGTVMNRAAYIALAGRMAREQGLEIVEKLPLGVEQTVRVSGNKKWVFTFNNTMKEKQLENGMVLKPFEMQITVRT